MVKAASGKLDSRLSPRHTGGHVEYSVTLYTTYQGLAISSYEEILLSNVIKQHPPFLDTGTFDCFGDM